MLGQHLRLWITMHPALGHRSYCVQSQSVRHTDPVLVYCWSIICDAGQHKINIDHVYIDFYNKTILVG